MSRKNAPAELLRAVEQNWKHRVLNDASRGSARDEVEYFAGAASALYHAGFEIPVGWTIKIMSGRRVVEGDRRSWAAEIEGGNHE